MELNTKPTVMNYVYWHLHWFISLIDFVWGDSQIRSTTSYGKRSSLVLQYSSPNQNIKDRCVDLFLYLSSDFLQFKVYLDFRVIYH